MPYRHIQQMKQKKKLWRKKTGKSWWFVSCVKFNGILKVQKFIQNSIFNKFFETFLNKLKIPNSRIFSSFSANPTSCYFILPSLQFQTMLNLQKWPTFFKTMRIKKYPSIITNDCAGVWVERMKKKEKGERNIFYPWHFFHVRTNRTGNFLRFQLLNRLINCHLSIWFKAV